MIEKDTEPYIVDGKIFQVYKIGKEPMNNQSWYTSGTIIF